MNRDFSQNKFYRMILFLPIMIFRIIRKLIYMISKDSRELRQLKDTKKGETCFIIGNGPSLTVEDLEAISYNDTFAANRIYSIFEKTSWRPTYYLAIDNNILNDYLDNILKVNATKKFLNFTIKNRIKNTEKAAITFINIYGRYIISPANHKTRKISYDVSRSFNLSYSVTGIAIQLAVYMGYKYIYLLGMDHTYSRVIPKDGILKVNSGVQDYFNGLKSKDYSIQYIDAVNSYYEALKKHAEFYGRKVFNVTRGGKLEVFERMNLDSLLSGENCNEKN